MKRTKEEAQQTKEQLLTSAKRLFTTKGFSATSITDIVQDAGLTRGAAYWHFKNKDEIFIAVVEQALNDMMEEKERALSETSFTPREKLQAMLSLPLRMSTEYALVNGVASLLPTYPQLSELEKKVQDRKNNLKESIRLFLEEGKRQGALSFKEDPETTTKMFFLLFEGLYFHSQEQPDISNEDLFHFLDIIFCFH